MAPMDAGSASFALNATVPVQVTKAVLAALPLTGHEFHGDWNYTLTPTPNA